MLFKKRKREKAVQEMNAEELRIKLKELDKEEAKEAAKPPSKIPSWVGLSRLGTIDSVVKLVKEGDKEAKKLVQELLDDNENRDNRLWAFFALSKEIEDLEKLDKEIFAKFEEFKNNPANKEDVEFVEDSVGALKLGEKIDEFKKKSRANAKLVRKWHKRLDELVKKWNKEPKREPRLEAEELAKDPIDIELMRKLDEM